MAILFYKELKKKSLIGKAKLFGVKAYTTNAEMCKTRYRACQAFSGFVDLRGHFPLLLYDFLI